MARTLIVTDPLTLLAPPGPQTARKLTTAYPLALLENAADNTLRLYEVGYGAQSVGVFIELAPLVDDVSEFPSPAFGSAQAPEWAQINYI